MLLDHVAVVPVLITLAITIALKFLFYNDASKLRKVSSVLAPVSKQCSVRSAYISSISDAAY
jgi:hypothetical protein